MSIKLRIYLSFFLLGALFIINGAITIIILSNNRNLAAHIKNVTDPSLRELDDFQDMLLHSKIYTTNCAFLKANQNDKDSLLKIRTVKFVRMRSTLPELSAKWKNKNAHDSLRLLLAGFENLLGEEKRIMDLLQNGTPFSKQEAEKITRDRIIPQTDTLSKALLSVIAAKRAISEQEQTKLEESFQTLLLFILILCISTVGIGVFFAKYFTGVIVKPINRIRNILNDLGKGIISKIREENDEDEIGKMIGAVNHLSDQLQHTAVFAQQTGDRNFNVSFQPMSDHDELGKALVAMRDKLRSVDESLNQAQHIARLGSWEWRLDTNLIFWSDELYHIFGVDKSSFIPSFESAIEFVHPEDKNKVVARLDQLLTQHQSFSEELRITTAGGQLKYAFVKVDFSVDENNNVSKLFGIFQDLTEQKQQQQELKQFTERFHLLSMATNDSIWDWNLVTGEVWWNDHFYKAFSYDPRKGVPTVGEWIMKLHPEDRETMVSKLKSLPHSNTDSWHGEFRFTKADGTIGFALNKAYVLRDDDKKPIRVIGAIQDITERKVSEQKISDSEKRYRQIVETAQEGIWMIDEKNYTVFVNKKMCEMLGYAQEEMIGRQNYDFKDAAERQKAIEQIQRRRSGISETHETSYITKSGKRVWAHVSTNPILDENGNYKGALAMVTDISQRKLQQELLKKSEADLEKKNELLEQKNKELEQFAYITSHDLQEPLRTITSFVERFQQQYKDKLDDTAQKFLYFILQGSERMKTLIKDLLDYSRIGKKKELVKVDCNEILNVVLSDLNTAIDESKVEIRAGKLPVINGYGTEIKQLFQNLIINAIKFRKKEVVPHIEIASQSIEGGWEFRVRDNGIGIDEQHSERIFVIFQRLHTRTEYEGSGIGLSHCKKIVELHGGRIWVKSEPGEGSTFHFTILENHN